MGLLAWLQKCAELPGTAAPSTIGSCQIRKSLSQLMTQTCRLCHHLHWQSKCPQFCLSLHITLLRETASLDASACITPGTLPLRETRGCNTCHCQFFSTRRHNRMVLGRILSEPVQTLSTFFFYLVYFHIIIRVSINFVKHESMTFTITGEEDELCGDSTKGNYIQDCLF